MHSMHALRRVASLLLLTTFVVGGGIAPLVHEAEHALEHREAVESARLAHDGHDHDSGARVEQVPEAHASHDLCTLLHAQWSGMMESAEARLRPIGSAGADPVSETTPRGESGTYRTIRGPPWST